MKKLLSILGTISLTASGASSIIACKKPEKKGIKQQLDSIILPADRKLGKIIIASDSGIPTKKELLDGIKAKNSSIALTENDFTVEETSTSSQATIVGAGNFEGKVTLNYSKKANYQLTIYIDKNGVKQTTNKTDLTAIDSEEIIQIGFFQNDKNEIQAVYMPKKIKKVPDQLPTEITSLYNMFSGASSFNQDISNWNTANVTNMEGVFYGASSFNQDLSSWKVDNVTDMSFMFSGASSFNQDISKWNTANVTHMEGLFYGASSFNQDISKWNTANVTHMEGLFYGASSFNQDISKWNTANVTNMRYMFYGASSFNQDISNWNTANVTDMKGVFYGASSFNQDLSSWKVDNVTDMSFMFNNAKAFNQDLSSWKVDNVTNHDSFDSNSNISSDHLPKWKK